MNRRRMRRHARQAAPVTAASDAGGRGGLVTRTRSALVRRGLVRALSAPAVAPVVAVAVVAVFAAIAVGAVLGAALAASRQAGGVEL